jgi:hypothetical protein
MDKFYLAKTIANERKREIENDLKVRHMLKEANWGIFKVSKSRRLVMRFAPAVIIITILALTLLV